MTSSSASVRPGFSAIYSAEFGFVWRLLRRLGVADRFLEDAVQDLFMVVYRRLDDYNPERPLRPWLAGIAYRVASDSRRRAHVRREVGGDHPAIDQASCPPHAEATVQAHEARTLVYRALDPLPTERRAILVLHDIEGHTVPDIAEVLEVPLNTAYSRLRLAREQFEREATRLLAGEEVS